MSAKYQLSWIELRYGRMPVLAFDELTLDAGGLYVLAGPNGSGKSTLLNLLAFLTRPAQGNVVFNGQQVGWLSTECSRLRQHVTLLQQTPYLFTGSVASNVGYGARVRGWEREMTERLVRTNLQRVGLAGFESRNARRLSGGESRRVAVARALTCKPEVLLLDEPLANVDRASVALLESLIISLHAEGITIALASHDERLGEKLGGKVIYLEDGKLLGVHG